MKIQNFNDGKKTDASDIMLDLLCKKLWPNKTPDLLLHEQREWVDI